MRVADLSLFHAGEWSVRRLQIRFRDASEVQQLPSFWDAVVPVSDGLLCWVDLWQLGVVLCDVFKETPRLQYLPLPRDNIWGQLSNRNLCATAGGGILKFINIFPVAAMAALTTRIGNHDDMKWVKDGMVDATELWVLDSYKGLRCFPLDHPVVSMDEPDHICFWLHEPPVDGYWDYRDRSVGLLMVNTRSKTIHSVSPHEDGLLLMRDGHLIPSNVSYFFNSYPSSGSDGTLVGPRKKGNARPLPDIVDEQLIRVKRGRASITTNPTLQPASFAEPSVQASEIFEAFQEIPSYGLEHDEPPAVSCVCLQILAVHGDSVLIEVSIEEEKQGYMTDQFVYNASTAAVDPPAAAVAVFAPAFPSLLSWHQPHALWRGRACDGAAPDGVVGEIGTGHAAADEGGRPLLVPCCFIVLLKVLPDSRRGRTIRTDRANLALATVGISHIDWGVRVVDGKGISSRTAEEHGSVLADIIVLIISGHPAHMPLVVLGVVKLPVVVLPSAWGHLCRLWFLDSYHNQQIKVGSNGQQAGGLHPTAQGRAAPVPAAEAGHARAVPSCWHRGPGTGTGPWRAWHGHCSCRAGPFLYRAFSYRARVGPAGLARLENYSGGVLMFVKIFPRCGCGDAGDSRCERYRHTYTIHTWTTRIGNHDNMKWVKDSMVDATMLWALDSYKSLWCFPLDHPVMSMDEPDHICFWLHEPPVDGHWDYRDRSVDLLMVNTRSKTIHSVSRHEDGLLLMRDGHLIPSNVSYFFNSYPSSGSDGTLVGPRKKGNERPPPDVVHEQLIRVKRGRASITINPTLQPASFAEPSVQASEIFEAFHEIPSYGLEHDEVKVNRILSRDNCHKVRSLLRLPKNLRIGC
ncbi:unnamed protein product [Miscanthus lutarioriparius]|uniref:DUF1618 domain-containing protein n=1 Tax=Miscanthus lutarioriparius TaxID=422564 RepID=A0A811QGP9_9POAL|nr:unnamed protein product [Miscanthus lutarioriparius]